MNQYREGFTTISTRYHHRIRKLLAIAALLTVVLISVSPALAGCVTVSQARQMAAAGKLRPEYARMTDQQLYDLGFCADLPTTTTAPASGCQQGYYKFSTSAGHCCRPEYPYYFDGMCHQCADG
ncbi:MAG: hypothetical protein LUO97_00240, partial [Methanomicrobiales archaeon]|nr:hypothetical protein [Methanomicrobiales archaeon]